jgi:hypothetical protein
MDYEVQNLPAAHLTPEEDAAKRAMMSVVGAASNDATRIDGHYRDQYRGGKTAQEHFDATQKQMYDGAPVTEPTRWLSRDERAAALAEDARRATRVQAAHRAHTNRTHAGANRGGGRRGRGR